jgi:hypothetical protein
MQYEFSIKNVSNKDGFPTSGFVVGRSSDNSGEDHFKEL